MAGTGSEVVDRLVEATRAHDAPAMVACFHEDYRSEQPLHPDAGFVGREQVGKNWSSMFAEVPDLAFDVLRSARAGDEVWTEIHVHGRHTDGRSFDYRGMAVWGLRDELIAWARLYFETVEVGGAGIEERTKQVLGNDRATEPS